MKRLLAYVCIMAAPLFLAACGNDDPDANPAIAEQADAAPGTPLPPPLEEDGNGPPSAGLRLPCDRAVCNDIDQRDWRVNPPPDDYLPPVDEYVLVAAESPDDPTVIEIRFIKVRIQTAAGR